MKMNVLAPALLAPMIISACVPAAPAPMPAPDMAECDADAAQEFVGKLSTPDRNIEIQRLTGARTLRWIGPDQAVTMDYRTDRVNVFYDANTFVTQITCG